MDCNTRSMGYIYLIRFGETNFYKIGYAANPQGRMRGFQIHCPEELTMVNTWPGTIGHERAIHAYLSRYHKRGEWFEIDSAKILKMVDEGFLAYQQSQARAGKAERRLSPQEKEEEIRSLLSRLSVHFTANEIAAITGFDLPFVYKTLHKLESEEVISSVKRKYGHTRFWRLNARTLLAFNSDNSYNAACLNNGRLFE